MSIKTVFPAHFYDSIEIERKANESSRSQQICLSIKRQRKKEEGMGEMEKEKRVWDTNVQIKTKEKAIWLILRGKK